MNGALRLTLLALLAAMLLSGCGGRSIRDGADGTSGAPASDAGIPSAGSGGSSQSTDWSRCNEGDTCVLDAVGPCGPGCEPIPLSRLIAINSANEAAFEKSKPETLCIAASCPELENAALQTQNYYAQCVSGRCQAFDVRTTDLSLCNEDSDCALRYGTSCCGCDNIDHLIAVSTQVDQQEAFCPANSGCTRHCTAPPLPPFVAPWCTAGRCVVHYPP